MSTIVIADKDSAIRTSLKEFLSNEGYNVLLAKDGLAAFNMAILDHPDLIITEIDITCIDGFELLMSLQISTITSIIPIIFISSETNEYKSKLSKDLGAKDYFLKPINFMELLNSIKKLLKSKEHLRNNSERLLNNTK